MVDTTERTKEEVASPAERLREWHEHGIPLEVLDEERFEAWLDRQSRETIVGIAGDPDRCPIARYLTSVAGIEYNPDDPYPNVEFWVSVCGNSAAVLASGTRSGPATAMPAWGAQFVTIVDRKDEGLYVTAEEAAHCLDVIEERRRRAVD